MKETNLSPLSAAKADSSSSGIDESMEMQDDKDGDVISMDWSDSEKHRGRFNDVFKMPRTGNISPAADLGVASLADTFVADAEFSSLDEMAESPELWRSFSSIFVWDEAGSGKWKRFSGADIVRYNDIEKQSEKCA